MNITEPIRRIARLRPDSLALVRPDGSTLSYGVFDRLIDSAARRAAAFGLRPGDIAGINIAGPDEAASLVVAMALARMGVAGAATSLPPHHLRVSFGVPGGVALDASWLEPDGDGHEYPVHRDAAALARIFASSGTTGTPKHIPVSHRLWEHRMTAYTLGLDPAPAVRLIDVAMGITWGFTAVMRTLWAGGTIVLSGPGGMLPTILRHGVTSLTTSPASLRNALASTPAGPRPPTLRCVEVSGAPLPAPLLAATIERLCPDVTMFMGASETGGTASAPLAAPFMQRLGAVGILLPGIEIEALDPAGAVLPPGQPGALRVRSSGVAPGYFDPPPGPSPFRDGWFHTGDHGAVLPGGQLVLSGRTGDLINAGGVKVSPLVIEEALARFPGMTEAAAFAVPDAYGVDQIWAAIVVAGELDPAALGAFCGQELPGARLHAIMHVPALPRTENGKVRRDALVQQAREQQARARQPSTPG